MILHLWYKEKFGYSILPYDSIEKAIDTWPTTSTALSLRPDGPTYGIYAPYGLEDLFSLTVRPNKIQITREVYEAKCRKGGICRPKLQFATW